MAQKSKFTKKFTSLSDLKELKKEEFVGREKTKFLTQIKAEEKQNGSTK
jgi:hypothetical protein